MSGLTDGERELRDILARFGVHAGAVSPIPVGKVNKHWRVDADGAAYALRRYHPIRTAPSVRYEHAMLSHMAARGWPVAVALAGSGDGTLVEDDGGLYALFPFLRGAPRSARVPGQLRLEGQLLARLHREMRSFSVAEQREGFGRVWELDLFVRTERLPTFNEMMRFFARDHHDLAREIRAQRQRSLRELTRLHYGDLPDMPIHADFTSWNLLFEGDRLTGVLDFDLAHRDTRTADIAWSIMSDCAEPPADIALEPRAVREFVAGYASEAPLIEAELSLIVPLIRAQLFTVLAWALYDWAQEPTAHALHRIRRRLDQRLPALDARAQELEIAVRQGAEDEDGLRTLVHS